MPSRRPASAAATLADAALGVLWRPRALRWFSSRRPVVLMYHRVAPGPGDYFGPDVFEEQVRLLRSRFHLIGPRELGRVRRSSEDIDVLLTFDDGFLSSAVYAAPILKRHQAPAIFFISTRHCNRSTVLWFAYLNAFARWFPERSILLDGTAYDLAPGQRSRSIRRLMDYLLSLKPHPQAMYDKLERGLPSIEGFTPRTYLDDHCAGMTWDHVREIASDPLFEIGIHTVDHPYLTRCDDMEMERQIRVNREELERVSGSRIRSIAYPLGDYDLSVSRKCYELEIVEQYAVKPRGVGRRAGTGRAEIPRIGVYKPSLDVVGFKVQWGNQLRRTPLRFG